MSQTKRVICANKNSSANVIITKLGSIKAKSEGNNLVTFIERTGSQLRSARGSDEVNVFYDFPNMTYF